MGTHPIFESDFDCLTDMLPSMGSESEGESEVDGRRVVECQKPNCGQRRPYDECFGTGKYFCSRLCTVRFSMECIPKGTRGKDRNENEEHQDLEEKTALKFAKE